ncbi:MAG: 6-carboxytetrahydropterin synthase QueD [Muribaculaceae bacterium]|nr:6-carboxytetrahydropterin synthase QueD [Muribaculaceae bacterium]
MYIVKKTFEFSAAHQLELSYQSACTNLHGHNWTVTVECRSKKLDQNGMVVDFSHIKRHIIERLDHKVLNHVLDINPTAENIARWICNEIPHCYRVDVEESQDNMASYINDDYDRGEE